MVEKNQKSIFNWDFFEDLTGEIPAEPQKDVHDIGQRIRKIRQEKERSLEDISNMTGFDCDFLAGIEKDEIQPQLGTVIKLSKALDSAFGRLVSGVGENYIRLRVKTNGAPYRVRPPKKAKGSSIPIKALPRT